MTLTVTALKGIPMALEGDDLAKMILTGLSVGKIALQDGDIIVIAQKIVSKSEGRMVNLADVEPSPQAIALGDDTEKDPRLVELILRESRSIVRSRPGLIIVEHNLGFICANAGIDRSNVSGEDNVLLLPENPDHSAAEIRGQLEEASGAKVGVIIIDSHGRPWRMGTLGLAIGLSGVPGVVDLRGEKDLFGDEMKVSIVGAADEVAAAASLMMGQVAEGQPVVHVRGFPYALREAELGEMLRPDEMNLFR